MKVARLAAGVLAVILLALLCAGVRGWPVYAAALALALAIGAGAGIAINDACRLVDTVGTEADLRGLIYTVLTLAPYDISSMTDRWQMAELAAAQVHEHVYGRAAT